eukprot:CAMPEP_0175269148 /NCGR_PEP_ID=MMETSP0093-20121207/44711_1 /TAXON_ID=311494 /ORGANISM="Alexandrium monilatum, Strain CCMP3105" /LENGTH=361 /DNA_ID=CAMNT_0016563799 /DNA_START=67 /DNA_END=1152 /DNA_ORIENTATION=+
MSVMPEPTMRIVLIGETGTGKSTAAGRMASKPDLGKHPTRQAAVLTSECGKLEIIDTPGRGSKGVAGALGKKPIDLVVVAVLAGPRMDGVERQMEGLANTFNTMSIDEECEESDEEAMDLKRLVFLVTDLDGKHTWTLEQLATDLAKRLGQRFELISSDRETTGPDLVRQVLDLGASLTGAGAGVKAGDVVRFFDAVATPEDAGAQVRFELGRTNEARRLGEKARQFMNAIEALDRRYQRDRAELICKFLGQAAQEGAISALNVAEACAFDFSIRDEAMLQEQRGKLKLLSYQLGQEVASLVPGASSERTGPSSTGSPSPPPVNMAPPSVAKAKAPSAGKTQGAGAAGRGADGNEAKRRKV